MALASGSRLGPYEILSLVGAGGMGEVYRARDPRLDRDVAVKVLPPGFSADPDRLRRFEQEARAAAALNHPNILNILDIGTDHSAPYVVSELLEGQTLREALSSGPLPAKTAIDHAIQIANGLAAAHGKGIIHRDLKPENLFITRDGRVKILDFGLARFQPSVPEGRQSSVHTETAAGTVMGTAGYMSPEQVRGEAVGPSSDVFSLGCVLYEMVSGCRAFSGQTAVETMAAVLRDDPAGLSGARTQIPGELARLISHCLEKSAEQRFQSARDLAFDLASIQSDSGTSSSSSSAGAGKAIDSLAVLPFANAGHDPDGEYLSEGITDHIINSLSRISRLRVTSRSTVYRLEGLDRDPQVIGRELHVRLVLTGRVTQRGETLVVGTELVDVIEGWQLWGERYSRKFADIFEVQEEIAKKISDSLRMKVSGEEAKGLTKRFTDNSEAYQLYLRGRYYWSQRTPDSIKKGCEYFQRAIEKDPGYALAHSGLADCYSQLSINVLPPMEGWARAKAAAAAAVALDPELAEAHASLAFVRAFADFGWAAAEQEFRHAIELDPAYWVAPYWYGVMLTACGRFEEAERLIAQAQELEPLSPIIAHGAALNLIAARRYGDAVDRCLKAIDITPDYPLLRLYLGLAYEQESRYEEAITEFEKALQLLGGASHAVGPLAHARALAGHQAEALRMLHDLLELARQRVVDPYSVALIYVALGQQAHALDWLDTSCDTHGWFSFVAKGDPRLDPLRADPRFQDMLRRARLA